MNDVYMMRKRSKELQSLMRERRLQEFQCALETVEHRKPADAERERFQELEAELDAQAAAILLVKGPAIRQNSYSIFGVYSS